MEQKVITTNRQAFHDYFIVERLEAGIVLEGGEVKSVRGGNVNLKDAFCMQENGELFIKNMYIAVYDKSGVFNTRDSRRNRKLLIHKDELIKLTAKVEQKGFTLIPISLYFKEALVKVELALCQGKHTYDKKRVKMEKDLEREKQREIKKY